jgi:hypothetical protein
VPLGMSSCIHPLRVKAFAADGVDLSPLPKLVQLPQMTNVVGLGTVGATNNRTLRQLP